MPEGVRDLRRALKSVARNFPSLRALAREAGVSPDTVSRAVNGPGVPTVETVDRILSACGRRPVLDDGRYDNNWGKLYQAAADSMRERARRKTRARPAGAAGGQDPPASGGSLGPTPRGWALDRDPQARIHWNARGRGVAVPSEQGFRFTGRRAALTEIIGWLGRDRIDRRALVVTGNPGAGKSAVLARIVTTANSAESARPPDSDDGIRAPIGAVACAVNATGKTALEVANEVLLAMYVSASFERVEEFSSRARDALLAHGSERFNLIIDSLDEAGDPGQVRLIIAAIVLPLVETCADLGAQVVVGTRRRDADGDLLTAFGPAWFIDLDSSDYFDEEDLVGYALATLQLRGHGRDDNPYVNGTVARPVGERIARLADRNFLVAGLVSRTHGLHDLAPIDPEQISFVPTVDAALGAYVRRLGPVGDVSAEAALTALAFAESPGLDIDLWQEAIRALEGYQIARVSLVRFARSAAANFLIESSKPGSDRSFQLFHQALAEALLRKRVDLIPRLDDEQALTRAFVDYGRGRQWSRAPAYLLRSLPLHASHARMIDELLTDDDYLLHADLRRLIPLTENAASPGGQIRARLLHLTPSAVTATPDARAGLFGVTEALEGLGQSYRTRSHTGSYRAVWASVIPRSERTVLEGHIGWVRGLCAFSAGDLALLASAGDLTVRIWNPATGQVQHTLKGHTGRVWAVCAFTVGHRTMLASGGADTTVRIWDPVTGQAQHTLEGHTGTVRSICSVTVGRKTLLATSSADSTVRLWDVANWKLERTLLGHPGRIWAICPLVINGKTLLATGGTDSDIRIWDAKTGQLYRTLLGDGGRIWALLAISLGNQPLLVSAGDRGVTIWDPAAGQQLRTLEGHTAEVRAACGFTLDRFLLASGSNDSTVRIWDPATGQALRTLEGHHGEVRGVCTFTLGRRTMLATAGDRTIRIWDPAARGSEQGPGGHTGWVRGVCAFMLRGRPLLASAGDRTIRIWDASTGQLRRNLVGHDGAARGVCAITLGDRILLASAGDRTVRIWNPATGQIDRILEGHTDKVWAVCPLSLYGETLLVSAAADSTLRIWDPETGFLRRVLKGQTETEWSVCAFTFDGNTVLASAGGNTVRIWDPSSGRLEYVLRGHKAPVRGVCALVIGDRTFVASASADSTVRIWDPATGKLERTLTGHTGEVRGVCAMDIDGKSVLASAGERTVYVWDPNAPVAPIIIPVHHPARAVAWTGRVLAVGLSVGVLVIEPYPNALINGAD